MRITTKINIDLQRPAHPAVINAVQGDKNSRCLEVSLYSGGSAWQIPGDVTVAMRYCKSDKTKGYYDTMPDGSSAWQVSGNVISILLAPQMLTVAGPVFAQLEMIQGAVLLATYTIRANVEPDPAAGVLVSEDYINWLQWVEGELDKYLEKVKVNSEILGGTAVGPINMNGQALTGLNVPTAADGAANKWYVDTAKDSAVSTANSYADTKKSEAVAESKTYTNEQVRKAAPRNLLDNSDFRNPVNQRGQTNYTAAGYMIDRWRGDSSGTLFSEIVDSGLTLVNNDPTINRALIQTFEKGTFENGKTYTGYIELSDGTIYVGSGKATTNNVNLTSNSNDVYFQFIIASSNCQAKIVVAHGVTVTIKHVALYEGEYTTETLPEYQPKGYEAELAECHRYFRYMLLVGLAGVFVSETNFRVVLPDVRMRVVPTLIPIDLDNCVSNVDGNTQTIHPITSAKVGSNSPVHIDFNTENGKTFSAGALFACSFWLSADL